MLHQSVEYAKSNPNEVFTAVANENDTDRNFLERWFAEYSDFPVLMNKDDMKAIQMLWDESVKLGMLKSAPNVQDTVWTETIILN